MHLVHVFATFAPGGPQVRTARLIDALGDGFRHTLLAVDGRTSCVDTLLHPERVRVVDAERGRHGGALRYAWWFGGLLRDLRPDLLLTYNWGAMDAVLGARLRGSTRWIHAEDGFGPDEATGFKRRRVLTRRLLLRRAEAVVVPSRNLEGIAREIWRLAPERIRYVANGIDLERFRTGPAESTRRQLGLGAEEVLVGTVAHLRPEKDPLALLEAFAAVAPAHPRAHLAFVGDGVLAGALDERSAALGLGDRVHRVGFTADPLPFYRAFDLFALSSRTEQMPISLLEAMACSRPVISTAVGDVARMVAEENRPSIVPPGDRAAYVSALGQLLGDARLRHTLGAANRLRAEQEFDQRDMVETYRRLWAGL